MIPPRTRIREALPVFAPNFRASGWPLPLPHGPRPVPWNGGAVSR